MRVVDLSTGRCAKEGKYIQSEHLDSNNRGGNIVEHDEF